VEEIAALRRADADDHEPHVQLLVADGDAFARAQLALSVRDVVGDIVVLEADDGAGAIQLGLQQQPDIALLDIDMPRLGGIEAAITLRELQPQMRLGLQSADPPVHRERAQEHHLPLLNKLELDRTLAWLHGQVEWCIETRLGPWAPKKRSFVCGVCGYGAMRVDAPDRCPMCHAERMWVETPWRRSGVLATR
jgi:CheY-like chemotaxis protein